MEKGLQWPKAPLARVDFLVFDLRIVKKSLTVTRIHCLWQDFASTRALMSFKKTTYVRENFSYRRSPHIANFSTLFDEFVFDFALTLIECVNKTVIEMMFFQFSIAVKGKSEVTANICKVRGELGKTKLDVTFKSQCLTINDGLPICQETIFGVSLQNKVRHV